MAVIVAVHAGVPPPVAPEPAVPEVPADEPPLPVEDPPVDVEDPPVPEDVPPPAADAPPVPAVEAPPFPGSRLLSSPPVVLLCPPQAKDPKRSAPEALRNAFQTLAPMAPSPWDTRARPDAQVGPAIRARCHKRKSR